MQQDPNDDHRGRENTLVEIKKYLTVEGQPLSAAEFYEFWYELTEEEKEEFRRTELK